MRCRGGLARGGSGVGAPPSHAEKAVGVGGKSGAKWRNQSDQLRIAMSASKSGPQVTHLADNASLLTNAVVMPGWLWCMLSTAQSQLAHKPSTASTTRQCSESTGDACAMHGSLSGNRAPASLRCGSCCTSFFALN